MSADAASAYGTPRRSFDWRQYIIYIGFAIVFVVFAITLNDKGFLEPLNLLNIFRQTAIISIMAVAMTFVIAAGQVGPSGGAGLGLPSGTTPSAPSPPGAPPVAA